MKVSELINNIQVDIENGNIPEVEDIRKLEELIRSSDELRSDEKAIYLSQLFCIKKEHFYKDKKKWDIFLAEIKYMDDIPKTKEFLNKLDKIKDKTLTQEELESLESEVYLVLKEISKCKSITNSKYQVLISDEIEKRINIFKNRLKSNEFKEAGKFLKNIRTSQGYSLNKLSSITGVSASYLHRIETNKSSNVSVSVVKKIANSLNIDELNLLSKFGFKQEVKTYDLFNFLKNEPYTIDKDTATKKQRAELSKLVTYIFECDDLDKNQLFKMATNIKNNNK